MSLLRFAIAIYFFLNFEILKEFYVTKSEYEIGRQFVLKEVLERKRLLLINSTVATKCYFKSLSL